MYVDRNRCEATTDADVETDLTFTTSVIYYYIDALGREQATSDSGSTSAGAAAWKSTHKVIDAGSEK